MEYKDELIALEAIYSENFSNTENGCRVNFLTPLGLLTLEIFYPSQYPSIEPHYTLSADWPINDALDSGYEIPRDFQSKVAENFHSLFTPGQVVVFEWCECLKDLIDSYDFSCYLESKEPLNQNEIDEINQIFSKEMESPIQNTAEGPVVYTCSSPITDRKSVFLGHCAFVKSIKDVEDAKKKILTRATHNISAYRFTDTNGIRKSDCDDDGESAAGPRLLHMLELSGADNVLVIVSRWYGGIQFGPARFKHINNAGRNVLSEYNFIKSN